MFDVWGDKNYYYKTQEKYVVVKTDVHVRNIFCNLLN